MSFFSILKRVSLGVTTLLTMATQISGRVMDLFDNCWKIICCLYFGEQKWLSKIILIWKFVFEYLSDCFIRNYKHFLISEFVSIRYLNILYMNFKLQNSLVRWEHTQYARTPVQFAAVSAFISLYKQQNPICTSST